MAGGLTAKPSQTRLHHISPQCRRAYKSHDKNCDQFPNFPFECGQKLQGTWLETSEEQPNSQQRRSSMYGSFSALGAVHGVSAPMLSQATGPLPDRSASEVFSSTGLTAQQLRQTSTLGASVALAGLMPGSRPSWDLVAARPSSVPSAVLSAALAGTTTEQLGDESDSDAPGHGRHGRKPQMQGRFSGRLALKEDERRLAEECRLLGPLLGGVGKRTDKSRLTLAKIVRGIACGAVRRHCEEREGQLQALRTRVLELESILPGVERLQDQLLMMRAELDIKDKRLAELEPDLQGLSRAVRVAQQHELIRKNSQSEPPGMVPTLTTAGMQQNIPSTGGGLSQRYSLPMGQPQSQLQQPSMQQQVQQGQQSQLQHVPSGQFASVASLNGNTAMNLQTAAALASAMMVKRRSSSGVGNGGPAPTGQELAVDTGVFGGAGGSCTMASTMSSMAAHGVTGVTGAPGGARGDTPALPHPFMTGCPPVLDQVRVSVTGSGLGPTPSNLGNGPSQQQCQQQGNNNRPPLSTSRSLERAYTGNLNAAAQQGGGLTSGGSLQQNNSLPLGSGALPLQSPFCINIPSGTSNGGGGTSGSSIFNMAALLAQHNAQQQQQQQQTQPQPQTQTTLANTTQPSASNMVNQFTGAQGGAGAGNTVGMTSAASVGSGLFRAASSAMAGSSDASRSQPLPLPFPDMTRQASTNADTLTNGVVPGFGGIKMGSMNSQQPTSTDGVGWGPLSLPGNMAGFPSSRRPSDPSGNMPTSEVIRRLSTADNVSNPGSGNATATGAVLTTATDGDTATVNARVTADGSSTLGTSGTSGLHVQVKESPDSRHSSQGGVPGTGAGLSPGPQRGRGGKRGTGEDLNGGFQVNGGSCKRAKSTGGRRERSSVSGAGGGGGGLYPVSSPRGSVDALHLLTDVALIESGEGGEAQRQGQLQGQGTVGEVYGQHAPPLGHPLTGAGGSDNGRRISTGTGIPGPISNRSSPRSMAQIQTGQLAAGAMVSPEVQTLARDMNAPPGLTQMQVAARQQQLAEQLTDQLAEQVQQGGIGGSGGGSSTASLAAELMPSPSPLWGGHYSLAVHQQQMADMQAQLMPLRSMSSGGAPNIPSLTSAPSWLQQLPHIPGGNSSGAATPVPHTSTPTPHGSQQFLHTLATVPTASPPAGLLSEQEQHNPPAMHLDVLQAQQQQQQQQHHEALQQQQQQQHLEAMHQQQLDALQQQQQQQQQMMHHAQQQQQAAQQQLQQQHQHQMQQMQAAQQQQQHQHQQHLQQMQAAAQQQQQMQQMQVAQQQQQQQHMQQMQVQQARHSNLGNGLGLPQAPSDTWVQQQPQQMQPQGPSITTAMPTQPSPFGASMQQQQQFPGLQSLEHVTVAPPLGDTGPLAQQQSQQLTAADVARQELVQEHVNVPLALCRGMSTEGLAFNPSQGLYNIHNLDTANQQQQQQQQQQAQAQAQAGGQAANGGLFAFSSLQQLNQAIEQQQQATLLTDQQPSIFSDVPLQQTNQQQAAPLQQFADTMQHPSSYMQQQQQQGYTVEQQQTAQPQSTPQQSEQLLTLPSPGPNQMMFFMASN